MGEIASMIGGAKRNAEARHDWPDGDYVGATCRVCGVRGFHHPKRAPAYCWPHWQEAQREAEWNRAKWEADMTAEYGLRTTRPAKENEGHG